MKRVWISLGIIVLAGPMTIMLLFMQADKPRSTSALDLPMVVPVFSITPSSKQTPSNSHFKTGLEQMPASISDIDIPGNLREDDQGNIVVDLSLRHLFDFFLTATGEESSETILARLRAYLGSELGPNASQQAIDILTSYLAYLDAIGNLNPESIPAESIDIEAIAAHKQKEQALRSQYLNPEVQQVFFGLDDAHDNYVLEVALLDNNEHLSNAEKSVQHQILLEELPQELRYQVEESERLFDLHQAEKRIRNSDPPDLSASLFDLRSRFLDQEKAVALAEVDQRQAQWQGRINRYLNQRQAYLSNPGISDPERRQLVAGLRQEQFSQNELKRVEAYEHIHDKGELDLLR